jgi:hypothetical protein
LIVGRPPRAFDAFRFESEMSGNVIEIRPVRGGWEFSEMSEQLVFPTLEGAVTYSRYRLAVQPGEIRIYDAAGTLVETITGPTEK